jgi:hypothetical protein
MRTIRQKNRCGRRQRGKFSNKIMHQCVTLRTAATATANRSMTDTEAIRALAIAEGMSSSFGTRFYLSREA